MMSSNEQTIRPCVTLLDTSRQPTLVPLMSGKDKIVFFSLVLVWGCTLAWFWAWWLQPIHNIDSVRYVINSLVLFWATIIPGYFILIFSGSRVADSNWLIPSGWRVAMVVTKAPSEPMSLVQHTLAAALAQHYPHDTWLADEDPSPEMLDWCAKHGVRVSTRKGLAEYHCAVWPRRTKCKEGNLAYFYDSYGYENYDFVVQLDADHVPDDGYLEEMIRPFADGSVGYVSAPSICDSNAAQSWAARGRLYLEGAMHGALQAGYNGGRLAPLCIGSHYAVRTKALKAVGGLGPELAEDHSTTLIMNAGGWRGVHALNAIAHGEGPPTFPDLAVQEFQWSRSLATIFLRYTPTYIWSLPLRLKAQFLFSQAWYTLFSLSMLAMILIPIIALVTRSAWAGVIYLEFFIRLSLVTIAILLLMNWVKRRGWFRPASAKLLSWEGTLFLFARWPWALLGVTAAIVDWIRGRNSGFRVTPKGADGTASLPLVVLLPTLLISIASGLPVVLIDNVGNATGFYVFAAINSIFYLAISIAIVVLHAREQGRRLSTPIRVLGERPLVKTVVFAIALVIATAGVSLRGEAGMNGLLWGTPTFRSSDRLAVSIASTQKFSLGVYDPQYAFSTADNIGIEHVFVSWMDSNESVLKKVHDYAQKRKRWLMITVEPWARIRQGSYPTLLKDIAAGDYDPQIDRTCSAIAALGSPVFIRWGHEMEAPTGRYPWAQRDGPMFIGAYRHFVDRCRKHTKDASYVWSPRGDMGNLGDYFPGNAYVDHIGLSLFSLPAWEIAHHGHVRSFAESFAVRYERVSKYRKPVMIAEFAVLGDDVHRRTWLAQAFSELYKFPLLDTMVYFNAKEIPGVWEEKYGVPNWAIDPKNLQTAPPIKIAG